MRLDAAVTEFFYAKDFTLESTRFYRRSLSAFQTWAESQQVTNVEDITLPLMRRYLAHLRERIVPRTGLPLKGVSQHHYADAARAFLRFCVREEWLSEKVPARIELPKKEKRVLKILANEQVERLIRAADKSRTPLRDRAVLTVLVDTGIRVAEIQRLTLDDVHFHANEAWLTIRGKGRKEREVPLGKKARLILHRYIHSERVAPHAERHVFVGKHGPLTNSGYDWLLYRARDHAGRQHFTGVRVSVHTLRHTFAVRYLEAGGDVYKLSRLMGHGSVAITEVYLRAYTAQQARQSNISVFDRMRA